MKIVSVFTSTEHAPAVHHYIGAAYRLDELVEVIEVGQAAPSPAGKIPGVAVDRNRIQMQFDWHSHVVPYIFPQDIALTQNNLLGMIFGLLGNFGKAWEYLAESPVLPEWDHYVRILNGQPIATEILEKQTQSGHPYEVYRAWHNLALVFYYIYPGEAQSVQRIANCFDAALAVAPDKTTHLFTTKHYANFLLDAGQSDRAEGLLAAAVPLAESELVRASLQLTWVQAMMKKLVVPYNAELLSRLKSVLWDTLQYYETHEWQAEAALLLTDASRIANIENSFSESLGYINKAIRLLTDEELTPMVGNAYVSKGILLYTWSKNGNPQFYRPALEAFQEALKIFDKVNTPDMFADIHHHLGIIYAEMPDENKKRSVWAALSASSFKEALAFFNKADYPYEYAVIANNYANAMTLYPPMKKADNYAKALELYNEALDIRQASRYPYERALTLMNYLEASWKVSNEEEGFNEVRFGDMMHKAAEIKILVADESLIQEADKHLEALEKLKTNIRQNA